MYGGHQANIIRQWYLFVHSTVTLNNDFILYVLSRIKIFFVTHSLYDGTLHSFHKNPTLFLNYAIATGLVFRKNQE
jgi:hypothetical protein